MAGPDDPDHTLTIRTVGDDPARYRLTFGSLLRGGAVYDSPSLGWETAGRVVGGTATIRPGEEHTWRADGPIHLYNNGRGAITVDTGSGEPFHVVGQGSIDTSCPTNDRRTVALGVLAGGVLGALSGVVKR